MNRESQAQEQERWNWQYYKIYFKKYLMNPTIQYTAQAII